jgi:hypothetical protein
LSKSGRGRGMKGVELYAQVRYAVQIEGLSRRAAARRYGIDPRPVCHGARVGEGPVLAMLALLRVAPLLPYPTLRAVPGAMPGRGGKAGS